MNILPKNDITSRNDCITEMLNEVKSMVSNFSHKYRLDFDDCYQHASLLMLEVYPNIPDGYNVKAYLNATVRRGLYQLLKRHIDYSARAFSLEMERTEDGATLADILHAPEQSCVEAEIQHLEKVTEVVHMALSQCRIEEQEYACMAFELTDYTPTQPANHPQLHNSWKKGESRRTDNMLRSIKRVFRKSPHVQVLIQREMFVL